MGKLGPAGIGGVLRNHVGHSTLVFPKSVEIRDSDEAELFSIRRALSIWADYGGSKLVIEGDSANVIKWARG